MGHFESEPLISATKSEANVLRLVSHGKRPAEIAKELNLTEKTVKQYIYRLCRLAGVHGQLELFQWVLTYHRITSGGLARRGLHPIGCECGSPYCACHAMPKAA